MNRAFRGMGAASLIGDRRLKWSWAVTVGTHSPPSQRRRYLLGLTFIDRVGLHFPHSRVVCLLPDLHTWLDSRVSRWLTTRRILLVSGAGALNRLALELREPRQGQLARGAASAGRLGYDDTDDTGVGPSDSSPGFRSLLISDADGEDRRPDRKGAPRLRWARVRAAIAAALLESPEGWRRMFAAADAQASEYTQGRSAARAFDVFAGWVHPATHLGTCRPGTPVVAVQNFGRKAWHLLVRALPRSPWGSPDLLTSVHVVDPRLMLQPESG